jgi:hypothetical protein
MQKSDFDSHKIISLANSKRSNMRIQSGQSFKQKVKEVLNSEEKFLVKKTLLEYNSVK